MNGVPSYKDFAPALAGRGGAAAHLLHRKLPNLAGGARILDFGFGDGALVVEFARLRPDLEFWGVDPLPLHLNELRASMPRGEFAVVSDLGQIDDGMKFDLIIASHVYYYYNIDDWSKLHGDLMGRLTSEGSLAVAMASKYSEIYCRLGGDVAHSVNEVPLDSTTSRFLHAEDLMRLQPNYHTSWDLNYRIDVDRESFCSFYAFVNRLIAMNDAQAHHCATLYAEGRDSITDKWLVYGV